MRTLFCRRRGYLSGLPCASVAPRRRGAAYNLLRQSFVLRISIDCTDGIGSSETGSLVFRVSRLPAAILLRLWFGRDVLRVRMLRARRQRGVLGRLPQARDFRLQFRDLREQQPNDGLRLRRLTRDQVFGDLQRHALDVANFRRCPKTSFLTQVVNGYPAIRKMSNHVARVPHEQRPPGRIGFVHNI